MNWRLVPALLASAMALVCLLLTGCDDGPLSKNPKADTINPALPALAPDAQARWLPGATPPAWACAKALTGAHATYDVGPGKTFEELDAVPWLALQAGDVVNIHYRGEPYRTKIGLRAQGSAAAPVILNGVTDAQCRRPIISGQNARLAQDAIDKHYYSAGGTNGLGLIFINRQYGDPDGYKARHIRIQNLSLQGANSRARFVAEDGKATTYIDGAAGIYAAVVDYLTIENCEITDNDNGIFVNTREEVEGLTSRHITLRRNVLHRNGVPGGNTQHNAYLQASQVLVEGNFIGQLMNGASGSSLKDRSSGTVIRYNHIIAAARALDLVETEGGSRTVGQDADYHHAWVYGNLIVSDMQNAGTSSTRLIHWGGDNHPEVFRRGPLYFYNNTVVVRGDSKQASYFSLFDLPTDAQVVEMRGNIVYRQGSAHLYLGYKGGTIRLLGRNWLSSGWTPGKKEGRVNVEPIGTVIEGDRPGLDGDYCPQTASPMLDATGPAMKDLPAPAHVMSVQVDYEYSPVAGVRRRALLGAGMDLGAFEGF